MLTLCTGNLNPDDTAGLEQWTPGGTLNWKCLQWKLHSLDTPPSYKGDNKQLQHWLNETDSWNGTASGRGWNLTSTERGSGNSFGPQMSAGVMGIEQSV